MEGGKPISFTKNVNRAKTKRWVEAKQYSYDGDDWGSDEYDEYDEGRPPMPQPPAQQPSTSVHKNAAAESKPLPFIRPADIYKRLQEERGQKSSSDAGPVSSEPQGASHSAEDQTREVLGDSSVPIRETSASTLPEVKRTSAFGTEFMNEPIPGDPNTPMADTEHSSLQHTPSQGFNSAVHQAFDVPETPVSSGDSVARSNSDSTSAISPIMGSRPVNEDKPPTITEESESGTPVDATEDIVFKPGHRRDLSLPSSNNSPSKRASIEESEFHPTPANAELSSASPADSPQHDQPIVPEIQHSASPTQSPTHGDDHPAPLRFSTSGPPQGDSQHNVPAIVPSMRADSYPEDTENDRLREEIIRSLSRENTPSEDRDPASQQGSRPETRLGEGFGAEQHSHDTNPGVDESPNVGDSPASHPPAHSQNLYSEPPAAAPLTEAPATEPAPKPRLTRRFSWESSSEEELEPPPAQNAAFIGQAPQVSEDRHPGIDSAAHHPETTEEIGDRSDDEKPQLTVIPPSVMDDEDPPERPSPINESPALDVPPTEDSVPAVKVPVEMSTPPPSAEPSLPGFRDILGIKAASERVRAFDDTREQFAAIDTGLNHWIRVTVNAHPEHMDAVEQSFRSAGSMPRPSASSRKFPKLSSLGNLTSIRHDAPSSGPGHARRPSATVNRQQVEQRGKDLLHSAGVLSGRAGGAAKGLFAKGRHKLNRGGDQ